MLDIKKVIPNDEFKAVYVTEENAKEFIEYAFPNEYNLDTLRIDKDEISYVYAVVDSKDGSTKNDFFILNRWYMERADVIDPDYGWSDEEYFEKHYKIVGDFMDESCKNCIYFHKFKRYVGNGFEESSCCTYFIQDNVRRGITPSYDVWVQDASDEGLCECYQRCNRTQKSFFPEGVKIPEMYSHEEIMKERVKDNYNYQRLNLIMSRLNDNFNGE